MGSARAARRIQPGGLGRPGGRDRIPPQGDRPSAASSAPVGRTSSAAVRRDRLRFGQEGSGGEGGSGPSGPELYSALPLRLCRSPPGPRAVSSAPSLPLAGGTGPPAPDACVARTGLSPVRIRMRRAARAGTGPRKRALEVRGDVGHPPDPS